MSVPQPVPPSWKDLGKSSNDLLGKDYPIGSTALEVKTSTPSNVVFKVVGAKPNDGGIISATAETKYTDRKNGVTFTQSWTNANVLLTNVELDNQLANGLKLDLATSLAPGEAAKSADEKPKAIPKTAVLNATYKLPGLHSRASLNVFKGPSFTADAVLSHDGFLLGTEASYDVSKGQITRYAAGAGYSAPEYAVTLFANDSLQKYTASYYHRVSRDVEAGAKAEYDARRSADGVKLEVGTKTYLDSASFIKAKINNVGLLSLGYTQSLRPGVKATLGLSLDTQRLNGAPGATPAHKVGASFVFEG